MIDIGMENVASMEQRHKQETKDLELKTRAMLKAAKKSVKNVVRTKIIQMEFDLKRKQEEECDSVSDMGQSSPSLSDDCIVDGEHTNSSRSDNDNKSDDAGEMKERSSEDGETSTETTFRNDHSTTTKKQHSVNTIDTEASAAAVSSVVLLEEKNVLVVMEDVHPRTSSSMDEITPQTNPLNQPMTTKKKKPTNTESTTTAAAVSAVSSVVLLEEKNVLVEEVHTNAEQMDEILSQVRKHRH